MKSVSVSSAVHSIYKEENITAKINDIPTKEIDSTIELLNW